MEHAPLRPVPARPAGPVDPATALREVGSWLPALDPAAARALALVVLAEKPRGEVAISLGVSEDELGRLLAAARKELRQTVITLGGSGWCERAEGLISDRLDGVLAGADVRRLDVHLRNCSRCVEHERRLVQATDALVIGLGGRPAPSPGAPVPLVEAPEDAPPAPADTPAEPSPAPLDAPEEPGTPADGSGEEAASAAAPPAAAPPAAAASAHGSGEEAAPADAASADAAPAVPAAPVPVAPTEGQIAAAAEVLVAKRTRGQIAAAVVWNSLIGIAILLTLATIALTIAGIMGAHL